MYVHVEVNVYVYVCTYTPNTELNFLYGGVKSKKG